jgi:hypothetical protein
MSLLDREEYIEQAYLFRTLRERIQQGIAAQDLLSTIREEILSTTKLPMAIDFLSAELRHRGGFAKGMKQLSHYFSPFQAFVIEEAEAERGKFDMLLALEILEREATYLADSPPRQGVFLYEFESISRNRLGYDRGLQAVADDPMFDAGWRDWILTVRRQIGLVDFAEMIYVRSEFYVQQQQRFDLEPPGTDKPVLFGEKEGKIALANRRKDPLLLFASLHRQLGYPEIPRHRRVDETPQILPQLIRRMERVEARLKLMEEEQKGGIDLTRFYGHGVPPAEYDAGEE